MTEPMRNRWSRIPHCPVCGEPISAWSWRQDTREFPGDGLFVEIRIVPDSMRWDFQPCGHEYRGEIVFPEETA